MDSQQGPTIEHVALCSRLCGSLDGRGFGGQWTHVYGRLCPFAVHLKLSQHCLLIGYTAIQNKKCKRKKKNYELETSSWELFVARLLNIERLTLPGSFR